ncbi:MAG: thioredoxin-dependent thiol peroxidase [Bacteroidia bacterium]|nr:thioredoxin-dependent thiol peroxidase [Bacteroidia bacterium]NNC85257.1 thioredoxin-dependent thiol peroxidase [Bacteroidia bacterium]
MAKLKEGDKAPALTGVDENGNKVKLSDYKGKKLILYFYPKDNTPGCTAESCNLRDNFSMLKKKGFGIVGVSPDSEKSHLKFIDKFDLPFTLIADTEKELSKKYGTWGKKKFMGKEYMGIIRTTFVIDEKGKIDRIFDKVKTKTHTEQILESYE